MQFEEEVEMTKTEQTLGWAIRVTEMEAEDNPEDYVGTSTILYQAEA